MFISHHQLEKRPVHFKLEIPAGEIEYDNKVLQASPLVTEGSAKLLNHSLGEIRLEGKLAVSVEAICDRCLETVKYPIDTPFDLVYMPAAESSAGEDEIDQGGIEVGYYEGNGLELNDTLREVVLLALPMQLLCREACKGICPVCGRNRNEGDCGCHAEPADDRWSKLKSLRAEIPPN